ncbi:MAG TPA: branched-chain amino acid ABC transporter permease [Desulfofustis sp.]|jgi:4-azaleucine resistance transporter AzlC|nr:branched-chain amino acid ABC transporter permease [Desulfofustis sp.]
MKTNRHHTVKQFMAGSRQALPIVLGYLPVAFAYGVLAQKSGLNGINAIGMSIIVFAGSAQLIGAAMFAAGASPAALIVTTFLVNLRHLLMSAALAPKLSGWKKHHLALFGYELTDETFALHTMRMARAIPPMAETFGVNVTAQCSWVAGSIIGFFAGGRITQVEAIGLDYALPAMFIALLVPQLITASHLAAAALAGALSTVLYLAGLSQSHVIAATIIGASAGLWIESWIRPRSS